MSDGPGPGQEGNVILREVPGFHPAGVAVGQVAVQDEMTELSVLIETEEWDKVEERLQSHPQELENEYGTALHLALEGGECPFNLIRTMIEMEPTLPSKMDHNHNTPLHTACAGSFAYDPLVILILVAAYPQAVLTRDKVESTTPLHMLLVLGGDVNMTCLTLLLDVAYSGVAGLPVAYVLAIEFLRSSLEISVQIAQHFPPLVSRLTREMAWSDPYGFPAFMRPFLHLPSPESVVRAPQLVAGQKHLLLIQDGMRQVPLHIAARRCLRKEVVQLLLQEERYPGAHTACSILERKERCPLFYCALYGGPLEAAECIFDCKKEVVSLYDQYGLTPYQASYNGPNYTLEERAMELNSNRYDSSEPIQTLFVQPKSWTCYEQLEFYLRITQQGRVSKEGYSVLHAVSAVVSSAQFMKCNIKLYPWQLKQFDKDGNLPLHVACKVLRPYGICEHQYWMKKDVDYDKLVFRLIPEDRAQDNPISILTKAYGKAASTLDKELNLPLHLAILSGKKMIDGVRSLIQAAPMALATRNSSSGLYPFMAAAMVDDASLTLDLLLANPMVMQSCLHGGSQQPAGKRARYE